MIEAGRTIEVLDTGAVRRAEDTYGKLVGCHGYITYVAIGDVSFWLQRTINGLHDLKGCVKLSDFGSYFRVYPFGLVSWSYKGHSHYSKTWRNAL
jgi:hypothetical protein